MLRVLGQPQRMCDGLTRRELLRVGGLSLFPTLTLPALLRANESVNAPPAKARSVIFYNLLGGPPQLDMFDMKPEAPVEIRGEFKPIQTSVPGIDICEHMPRMAQLMHRATLIRTVTHGYNAHNPLNIMTGWSMGAFNQLTPEPSDPPDIGAICQYLRRGSPEMPGAVCLPCYPGWGESSMYPGIRRPGPYGGFLGSQYDPLFAVCQPTFDRTPKFKYYDPVFALGEPQMPALDELPQMTANRLDHRRSLLQQIDNEFLRVSNSRSVDRLDKFQQRAFSMLTTSKTRDAFDTTKEPVEIRERYGRNLMGSSLLVARRLVQAGVPFVSVHAENFLPTGSFTYDTHENNFPLMRELNMPVLDQGISALVQDLDERGMLDTTLVVVMGEMGRSPNVNGKAGRDHWPQCGFSLLLGGGVRQGIVYGATDKRAAYPARDPVSPADLVATIYQLLGIDPYMTVPDRTTRPIGISHGGEPIWPIISG